MNELRLLFDKRSEGGFSLRLCPGWSGSVSEPVAFTPFLDDADYEDLRWYLEDFMDLPDGGSVVRARRVEAGLARWGRQLYDAVFKDGDHRELLNRLEREPAPRLLTIATTDAAILQLPWELMADSRGPLSRREITIRRQLETARAPIAFQTGLPLRVLYVVSRPGDLGFIDPRLSARSMLDALASLAGDVEVDFCRPPTLGALEKMLSAAKRERPYHIVHFDGHGTFLPEIELGALCFEMPDEAAALAPSKTDFVRADRLGDILAAYEIPLVILEACRTGAIGKVAVFRSVAPRLVEAGVGSVISMSHAVHVEAARVLLERFYRELTQGLTVGQALEEGRAALIANPHRWIESGPGGRTVELKDWHLPHLYQRGEDLRLVPRRPRPATDAPAPAAKQFDVFLSHQHASRERVEGLALQLQRYGLTVWLDKWRIGFGGTREQCIEGVTNSRFVLIACTREALDSKWVEAEKKWACADDPRGNNVVPLLLDDVELPPDLKSQLWFDFRNPANDAENVDRLAALVKPAPRAAGEGAEPGAAGRFRLASRERESVGAFPPAPPYGFHGRARELYDLERCFRSHRAVLLHAMGGMGKTTLAGEAAHWWTRTGLFPDGACFVSFEQPAGAERVIQVLGAYLEGNEFNSLPAEEQRRRARELFQQRRVLIVCDNFESALPQFHAEGYSEAERRGLRELFADWTAGEGQGRLLITCRPGETGLAGARPLELEGLARPDSLWLLVRVLEKAGVDPGETKLTRERLNPLLDLVKDHPLSIELVGPHLKRLTPEEICADFAGLLAEFKAGAGRERNESLLASLSFSTRRLSDAAQAALPWLGLFSGGVFEDILLQVSRMDPAQWESVRAELEATALIRIERDIGFGGDEKNPRFYVRFHPTLAYAAAGSALLRPLGASVPGEGDQRRTPIRRNEGTVPSEGEKEIRERFVGVYLRVMRSLDKALEGSQSRGALEILAREEANYRTAVRWAVAEQSYDVASALGQTFRMYLEMSGRLRERDTWVTRLRIEVGRGGFTKAAANSEMAHAWTLFTQGHPQEALQKLQALIGRLRRTSEFDPAFQLASANTRLGRVLYSSGLAEQAIPVLEEAVREWEQLLRKQGGQVTPSPPDGDLEATPRPAAAAQVELAGLSAALGDLSNALFSAGRLDEALESNEKARTIIERLGLHREVAGNLARGAQILMLQGCLAAADARYDEALAAARRAGDKELEGAVIQHQGLLADKQGQLDRAASLYQRALKLFQEMNEEGGQTQTCNLLGTVERKLGRLAEARAWYERSRELAQHLNDSESLGVAAQNIGIVCQTEGEAARQRGDEKTATARFREAIKFVTESLRVDLANRNQPGQAASHSQLGKVHLLLGELDEAESHAHQAREIRERLGSKEVSRDYNTLAGIAHARGDAAKAAEWERKRDAAVAELERRAQGGGGLPPQFAQAIRQLAVACAQAGFGQERSRDLDPGAESALAQLEKLDAPMPDLAAFLRRLAARELPAVPATLPPEIQQDLRQLLEAVREATA